MLKFLIKILDSQEEFGGSNIDQAMTRNTLLYHSFGLNVYAGI